MGGIPNHRVNRHCRRALREKQRCQAVKNRLFVASNRGLCDNSSHSYWLSFGPEQQESITKMVVRKFPRFPVSFSGTLVQRDAFKHKGSLRDLSLRGCRVETMIQPFTGMQVELHLHIPGEPAPITITNATVRWSGSHGVGMEFLNVAPPQQERLTRVIQQLAKKA